MDAFKLNYGMPTYSHDFDDSEFKRPSSTKSILGKIKGSLSANFEIDFCFIQSGCFFQCVLEDAFLSNELWNWRINNPDKAIPYTGTSFPSVKPPHLYLEQFTDELENLRNLDWAIIEQTEKTLRGQLRKVTASSISDAIGFEFWENGEDAMEFISTVEEPDQLHNERSTEMIATDNEPRYTYPRYIEELNEDTQQLFHILKSWQLVKSLAEGKSRFVIATNAILLAIAQNPPKNISELALVPGMGPTRLLNYGDEIIEIVKNFGQRT